MNGPEEMNEFEESLRRAMKPVDAPDGLAQRVMAMAANEEELAARQKAVVTPKMQRWPPAWLRTQAWVGGAVAAVLTVGVFTASQVHERREQERKNATAQFEASERITDQAMEHAREQLKRAGIELDQ